MAGDMGFGRAIEGAVLASEPGAPVLVGGGFTLIELVCVIVIVGIISVVALPRFVNLSSDARVATLNQIAGALKSAASIANSKCILTPGCVNNEYSQNEIKSPDGGWFRMYNGYPTANGWNSCISRWTTIAGKDIEELSRDGGEALDFRLLNAPNPEECRVRYNYSRGVGLFPLIEVTQTGC